jgi:catechol 2,3-dioxygenase-like lactoylglutathione lyase family enzyme
MGVLGVNHIAFRTPDVARLRDFYRQLLAAEEVSGAHQPLRAGSTLLVFFEGRAGGEDEIAFDVDRAGFDAALERATGMGLELRGPVDHTPWSKGFYARDPDGRRVEIVYDDKGVYWQE